MPSNIPSPPGTIDGINVDDAVYVRNSLGIVTDVLYYNGPRQVADRHLLNTAPTPGGTLQYSAKTVLPDGEFTVTVTGFHDVNGYEVDTFGTTSPVTVAGELNRSDLYSYNSAAQGGATLVGYDTVQEAGYGSAGQIDGVYYDTVMTIFNAAGQKIGIDWFNTLNAAFPNSPVAMESFDGSGGYTFYVGSVLREQKIAGITGEPYTSVVDVFGPTGALTSQTYYTSSGAVYSPTHNDLSLTLPTPAAVTSGHSVSLAGIDIVDPWAAQHPGTLALNISAGHGTLTMTGASGAAAALHVTGPLAQLNDDLATLTYHAPSSAGSDAITINVWNQAGVSVVGVIHETITA